MDNIDKWFEDWYNVSFDDTYDRYKSLIKASYKAGANKALISPRKLNTKSKQFQEIRKRRNKEYFNGK